VVTLGGDLGSGSHGGRGPQVRKAAAERLAEMVDPLLTELFRIAQSGENDAVRLAAIKDALDRAGYKPREKADLSHQIIKTVDADAWNSV
jgi:HEAT repeat protein